MDQEAPSDDGERGLRSDREARLVGATHAILLALELWYAEAVGTSDLCFGANALDRGRRTPFMRSVQPLLARDRELGCSREASR